LKWGWPWRRHRWHHWASATSGAIQPGR
jgi:hypothetical protein